MTQAVDLQTFNDLKELMDDAMDEFIQTYLENTPLLIQRIEAGLNASDAEAVFHSAHQLKGGSGSLGATQLAQLAFQIEQLGKSGTTAGVEPLLQSLKSEFTAVEAFLAEQS